MAENIRCLIKSFIWGTQYSVSYLKSLKINPEAKADFLITIDVETAADFIHWMDKKSAVKKAFQNRKMIEKLFFFSEEYRLPLTWFCTGHSFLEECSGHKPRSYLWATTSNGFVEDFSREDWFKYDPCGNCLSYPEWYFGDLFRKLNQSNIPHEIASHSFGHIRADLATEREFVEDMDELLRVFKEANLKVLSHAYPWNKVDHLERLSSLGIDVCRLKESCFPASIKKPSKNKLTLVYQSFEGRPPFFSVLKFGVDLACRLGLPFVWLVHPEELASETDFFCFRRLVEYVLNLSEKGKISVRLTKEMLCPK